MWLADEHLRWQAVELVYLTKQTATVYIKFIWKRSEIFESH